MRWGNWAVKVSRLSEWWWKHFQCSPNISPFILDDVRRGWVFLPWFMITRVAHHPRKARTSLICRPRWQSDERHWTLRQAKSWRFKWRCLLPLCPEMDAMAVSDYNCLNAPIDRKLPFLTDRFHFTWELPVNTPWVTCFIFLPYAVLFSTGTSFTQLWILLIKILNETEGRALLAEEPPLPASQWTVIAFRPFWAFLMPRRYLCSQCLLPNQ